MIKRSMQRRHQSLEPLSIGHLVRPIDLARTCQLLMFPLANLLDSGSGSLHFVPGPSYTTPYKLADVDGSISTRNSYASTPNSQVGLSRPLSVCSNDLTLFEDIFQKYDTRCDVYCLISGTFLTTCEAAHIVPKSRPDVSEIG
jgi:hypothetical protein